MISLFNRIKTSFIYRLRFRYLLITNFYWNCITNLLTSNKREEGIRSSINVFVAVWGNKHIDWFFKYCLTSLLMSENLPLISKTKKIKICIYTQDKDVALIMKGMKNHPCNYEYSITTDSSFKDKARDMMSNYLIHSFKECIDNNSLWLCGQPDLIFSNGSVSNLVTLADGKGVSIATPTIRVSSESIGQLNSEISFESNDLVDLIFSCSHSSFQSANDLYDNNTTNLGISTRNILGGLALIHNLPPPILCSPTKQDVSFFNRRPGFNIIDKVWPDMLFRESRLKIVISSDIATIVELTGDKEKLHDVCPDMKFNDFYQGDTQTTTFESLLNHSNSYIGLYRKE